MAEPVSFLVETFETGEAPGAEIALRLKDEFDLTPGGIIKLLKLARPIYFDTAAYGHFGRGGPSFSWEDTR